MQTVMKMEEKEEGSIEDITKPEVEAIQMG